MTADVCSFSLMFRNCVTNQRGRLGWGKVEYVSGMLTKVGLQNVYASGQVWMGLIIWISVSFFGGCLYRHLVCISFAKKAKKLLRLQEYLAVSSTRRLYNYQSRLLSDSYLKPFSAAAAMTNGYVIAYIEGSKMESSLIREDRWKTMRNLVFFEVPLYHREV